MVVFRPPPYPSPETVVAEIAVAAVVAVSSVTVATFVALVVDVGAIRPDYYNKHSFILTHQCIEDVQKVLSGIVN